MVYAIATSALHADLVELLRATRAAERDADLVALAEELPALAGG